MELELHIILSLTHTHFAKRERERDGGSRGGRERNGGGVRFELDYGEGCGGEEVHWESL